MILGLLIRVAKIVATERKASKSYRKVADGSPAGLGSAGPSPNDQRSNVKNPNNPGHRAAANNRSNQMNPNNPAFGSSRGSGPGGRGRG